jgi:hypothetical protein
MDHLPIHSSPRLPTTPMADKAARQHPKHAAGSAEHTHMIGHQHADTSAFAHLYHNLTNHTPQQLL